MSTLCMCMLYLYVARQLVELLILHGADMNLHGGADGWTPLFYAAMSGHSSLVEFLLSVGASTEVQYTLPIHSLQLLVFGLPS